MDRRKREEIKREGGETYSGSQDDRGDEIESIKRGEGFKPRGWERDGEIAELSRRKRDIKRAKEGEANHKDQRIEHKLPHNRKARGSILPILNCTARYFHRIYLRGKRRGKQE
jgi:hypothetical protein